MERIDRELVELDRLLRMREQMSDGNRQRQLESYARQTAEAWNKLIAAHASGDQSPEGKRRYTLAYNGLRRLLKKTLHYIIP